VTTWQTAPWELWVRGPNVTPGYWNRPEATAEAITDGWLHTGDAARRDDEGYYYIVDRWKDMYISGGENVYPAEVEEALYQLPEVAEAAVIGVPDERWVEVGRAVLVLRAGCTLSEHDVVRHCIDRLARFKVPKSVVFVDELPHNATGKVLKRELRDRFGGGAAAPVRHPDLRQDLWSGRTTAHLLRGMVHRRSLTIVPAHRLRRRAPRHQPALVHSACQHVSVLRWPAPPGVPRRRRGGTRGARPEDGRDLARSRGARSRRSGTHVRPLRRLAPEPDVVGDRSDGQPEAGAGWHRGHHQVSLAHGVPADSRKVMGVEHRRHGRLYRP
jgi:hypothetical protein